MVTVLGVDDDPATRNLLSALCHSVGWQALIASNGQQAVDIARQQQPDIVVMDIHMPVMGGLEAMQELYSDPQTQHIPIILMSATITQRSDFEALQDADAFLSKPFRPAELMQTIRKLLDI